MSFCCFSKTFTQYVTANEITKSMNKMFFWKFLQVIFIILRDFEFFALSFYNFLLKN